MAAFFYFIPTSRYGLQFYLYRNKILIVVLSIIVQINMVGYWLSICYAKPVKDLLTCLDTSDRSEHLRQKGICNVKPVKDLLT